MKNLGGAPSKLTPEEKEVVIAAFREYILTEQDPTVVGFVANDSTAIQYNVTRDNINDWQGFTTLKKWAIAKQEAFLLKQDKSSMAIFRLKQPQHGYKDKIEQVVDVTSNGETVGAVDPAISQAFTDFLKQSTKSKTD